MAPLTLPPEEKQVQYYIESLPGGVGLDMIQIPGGSFRMGQTEAEKADLIQQFGEKDYTRTMPGNCPSTR
jgi:formylglycine-generating enzyme required for sulfatase activity